MSLPRYPEYKDSRVEWLGEVPAHWEVKRLKYLCDIQTGDRDTENAVEDGLYPFFVRSQTVERINSYAFDGEAILTAGDGVGVGKVFHHYSGAFDFHQRVYMLNRFQNVSGAFLFHYLRENFYKVALEGGAKSTVDSLRRPLFTNFPVALPPPDEQLCIVDFATQQTAKIDALVAEQQRLIELLKEKRQAVISHAVTKGLNPNAPMKDSGIEWLGEVPAHWDCLPIKFLATIRNGSTPSRERLDFWTGGDYPWLNSGVVNADPVAPADQFVTPVALRECHLPIVEPPAVVVGITGQGRTRGMASMLLFESTLSQHLAALKPRDGRLDAHFLKRVLEMAYTYLRRDSDAAGSTKGAITCEELGNFKISCPPESEQQAIVDYTTRVASQFHILTAEATRAIDLLQERRIALISAAVTGQIDVRPRAQKA